MYNQLEFLPIGIFDSSTGLRTLYVTLRDASAQCSLIAALAAPRAVPSTALYSPGSAAHAMSHACALDPHDRYLNNNALSSLPAVTFDALSKLDTL